MQHLTEQEIVLHHYHDDESPASVAEHLSSCDVCRAEYKSIRNILALVDEMPLPERADNYGEQVWSRLRWKLGSERSQRRGWYSALAAAAVLAIAFFAGTLWKARNVAQAPPAAVAAAPQITNPDRILLVVVGDHLGSSERMLTEVANANVKNGMDLGDEQKRAADLVASNRLYRQAALQHGDDRLATLLADIEPILLEIAHSDGKLSPAEATALQKRIDSKGLIFKVRVVTAQKGMTSI